MNNSYAILEEADLLSLIALDAVCLYGQPIDQCYFCMSRVKLRRIRSPVGSLIEYTTARNLCSPIIFGVVRINGIKLVGSLKSISPQIGMRVKMINCGVSGEGTPFYEFQKY